MALVGAVLVLAGCSSEDPETTPTACLAGADGYLTALELAPDAVLLEGSVPISDCLVPDQSSAGLADVGSAAVAAATELNAEATDRGGGRAAVELGYLVGAIESGAADTAGIHVDLVRRIQSAARFSADAKGTGAAFERAFGEGYAAGRETG